jgi:hypothetical protein
MNLFSASTEKKRNAARWLSLVVCLAGLAVILGWVFDIPLLKSISSGWVSMKISTAVCFLLSGITLYFIGEAEKGEFDKAQVIISITSLTIILLMGILLFSTLLGVRTGIEELLVKDTSPSARTLVPGRPSVPTMLNFLLIALAGIFTIINPEKVRVKLKFIGSVVGGLGALAVIGYIIGAPLLRYYLADVNTPMACHTAILFVILGVALLCLSE